MFRTTLNGLALAAAIVAATNAAYAKDMSDLEIAHTAYTAGELDIRYAHLALAISENAAVRNFASTMVRDHTAVNDQAVALVKKLKVTPKDNGLSKSLVDGAKKKRAKLRRLDGKAFDCAYAENELGYHKVVNQTVETKFIPKVGVKPLKQLLSEALAIFKAHEKHAAEMVAALKCGS